MFNILPFTSASLRLYIASGDWPKYNDLFHGPFGKLCGPDWQRSHWFRTALERDAAMADMSRKHEYSRPGDRPALVFTKVENLAASRGL